MMQDDSIKMNNRNIRAEHGDFQSKSGYERIGLLRAPLARVPTARARSQNISRREDGTTLLPEAIRERL